MAFSFMRAAAPVLTAALLLSSPFAAAQRDMSRVVVTTEKLGPTTYMLTGAGGNIGVSAGPDAVFLIDDQFAPLSGKIQAAVKAISGKSVKFVLNTHWHDDHTGGNEQFGQAGAIIVAHENVRKRMSSDQLIDFFSKPVKASPKAALPVITFGQDIGFHLNGEELQVVHMPHAHTDGDAVVIFKGSDVVHMGDLFFNGYYPFIDMSSGGSVDGVIAAADKVLAMTGPATRFIPGHGPLARRADLQAYRAMLDTVSRRIRALVAQGKTLEQTVAAKPTAEFDASWGKGFLPPAKFVEMLYKAEPQMGR